MGEIMSVEGGMKAIRYRKENSDRDLQLLQQEAISSI
jgi:hypothetical protein